MNRTLSRRSFLQLIVPVPSGAEIVDPSFATTGSYGDRGGIDSESWTRETVYGDTAEFDTEGYGSYGPDAWEYWFYRPLQKVYDNAVSYTWEDFYSGQREVSFLFRTTTPAMRWGQGSLRTRRTMPTSALPECAHLVPPANARWSEGPSGLNCAMRRCSTAS